MYIPRFYLERQAFLVAVLLFGSDLFFGTVAWGLSTDIEQAIEIEADSASFFKEKGYTSYHGNIVLTQGSIRITGDVLVAYFQDNLLDHLIIEGNPAKYRQLPDDSEIYHEAQALKVQYKRVGNLLILSGQASFKNGALSASSERIEYDFKHGRLKLEKEQKDKNSDVDQDAQNEGRVRIIIKPKKDDEIRNIYAHPLREANQ